MNEWKVFSLIFFNFTINQWHFKSISQFLITISYLLFGAVPAAAVFGTVIVALTSIYASL